MIGSTRHSYKFANKDKKNKLFAFMAEYERVCLFAIDYIWNNLINDKYELPKFLDYKLIPIESPLGRKAFACAVNQAGGIVRSAIEKQKKVIW